MRRQAIFNSNSNKARYKVTRQNHMMAEVDKQCVKFQWSTT